MENSKKCGEIIDTSKARYYNEGIPVRDNEWNGI